MVFLTALRFGKRLSRARKTKIFTASQWDHPLYGSQRTPPEGRMKGLMKGLYPVTRTREYLRQGIIFRDSVKVMTVNYGTYENAEHLKESHKGVTDMILMNIPQMRYMNPDVQIETIENITPTPYITFYLDNGQFFHVDVDGKSQFEILSHLQKVIGKPKELIEQETAEETISPANFGSKFERKCICMVEGQVPCSALPNCTPGSVAPLRGRNINLNPKKNPFGVDN